MNMGAVQFLKPRRLHLRKRIIKPLGHNVAVRLGMAYRSILAATGKVRFIGITGSCGKTTTSELVAVILSREGPTKKCVHLNVAPFIGRAMLKVSPRDAFFVCEVSAHRPGAIAISSKLLRPDVAVVVNVARDHYGHYRSLEATAAEKVKLVEAIGRDGTAVLNADDEHVYAMRNKTKGEVLTYGLSDKAMVRAQNVRCQWPEPLSLDVCCRGECVTVHTQLLGEHWAYAVLAAITTGIALGVPLERAAEAITKAEQIPSRMSEHATPQGVTFVRDDYKSPFWTVGSCIDFMRKAKARRKFLVIGSVSDTPKNGKQWRHSIVRQATNAVDEMVFVGPKSHLAIRKGTQATNENIRTFNTLAELNRHFKEYLEPGDLVMVKGSQQPDHLDRLVLSQTGNVDCWHGDCNRDRFCESCRNLHAADSTDMSPV